MSIEPDNKTIDISFDDIVAYVQAHPRLLLDHPELLGELDLDHNTGSAVSLIERQVAVLREQNNELLNRLNTLIDTARDNDRLFDLTQRLILALLECNELGDMVDAIYYSFDNEFKIDHTRLVLFDTRLPSSNAKLIEQSEGKNAISRYLQFGQAVCGGLDTETIQFLFEDQAEDIGSAAIAPLNSGSEILGVLAIGNKADDYYKSSTGSLFLGHISDVLSRLIRPYFHFE